MDGAMSNSKSGLVIHTFPDALAAARAAAARMSRLLTREAVAARGRFLVAVSGGHSPWNILEALAAEDVPWRGVQILQVDERVAPAVTRPERHAYRGEPALARRSAVSKST